MSTRTLGRKATVFMQSIQVLKAEWFYRPVFSRSDKVITLSGNSRRAYWQDKFEMTKKDIHLEAYKNFASKRLLGTIK
jgi:hypothetical protein